MIHKKTWIAAFLAVMIITAAALTGCGGDNTDSAAGSSEANNASESENTLIVYYSYSGTTKRVAEHLQDLTGGTLYELELTDPYTGSSDDVSDRVFSERDNGKMPELSGTLPDVSKYDRILIGTPVWNDSMANPVLGYLQQTDFAGKTVAPFWTYITSQGTTGRDFASQIKNGTAADGLALRSAANMSDNKLDSTLQSWLDKLPDEE